jgi:hypothetical protein
MMLATGMFALFSAFLLLQGLRSRTKVQRLREQLDVLQQREAEAQTAPTPPANQLPLPYKRRAKRSASA